MEILQEEKAPDMKEAVKAVYEFIKKYPVVLLAVGGLFMVLGMVMTFFKKSEKKTVV